VAQEPSATSLSRAVIISVFIVLYYILPSRWNQAWRTLLGQARKQREVGLSSNQRLRYLTTQDTRFVQSQRVKLQLFTRE